MTLVPRGTPGARDVQVTALEMRDPGDLRPAGPPRTPAPPELCRSDPPDPALSRRCYGEVGAAWWWVDRLAWTSGQWADWVAVPGHELWTCRLDAALAGYFELHPDGSDPTAGSVELAYFGLLPGFEGQGLGGWLLTAALQRAWAVATTRRVWLHTCELDGPAALPNYRARGLREFTTWTEPRLLVEQ